MASLVSMLLLSSDAGSAFARSCESAEQAEQSKFRTLLYASCCGVKILPSGFTIIGQLLKFRNLKLRQNEDGNRG